ncbi:SusC/RagA family TonB-linked outer membrane protein [Mucilaginibacter sp. FT3.2]|uniref:SusC/RagA family TonB-linked outer membrane protein n=1 Tax=Mucilaginibacter sp. FT3.2 TaxID=2723090 RepID=UPI00160D7E27|nr:TonB-dependent receptor [Mucilaginibacter sp. FT3.2]MBB6233992.1 TonB-linked SusC/RagA family outer membrane protein [Mucilaginibacter sp. FT3.2]
MFKSLLLKGRFLGVLLCCLVSSLVVTAQTKYKGKVIGSDDKLPIIGASVRIQGSTTGAVTDVNGEYSLTLNVGQTLVVSYIGYQTLEVKVGSNTNMVITLIAGNNALNEVVVTGYTSQRKKDITGSVAVVNVASLKTVPSANTASLLQGQAAGVTVISSGNPGGGATVNVRGVGSIYSTTPLVLIDGVQGTLNDISPNDIESIQVLKDAGSASIYGVRGSNGVVVVTTKKGKNGAATISYDAFYGDQQPLKNGFKLADSKTYVEALYESYKNAGALGKNTQYDPTGSGTWTIPDYLTPAGAHAGDPNTDPSTYVLNPSLAGGDNQITKANKQGTDWFHEVFKAAPIQSHNITASGGNDKSTYLMSVNYLNQQGTLIDTYFKRYSVRANTMFNIGNHVRVGENAYIFYKRNPNVSNNQNEGNAISYIYREPPVIPVYDIAGNYAGTRSGSLGNSSNPVAVQDRTKNNRNNNWDINGNVYAEVDFLKHFTLRTSFGGTVDNYYYYYYTPTAYENSEGNTTTNSYTEVAGFNSNYTWQNTLNYNQQFGKHNVKFLAGTEAVTNSGRGIQAGGSNYSLSYDPNYVTVANGLGTPSNAVPTTPYPSALYSNTLKSFFGRVDYNFDDKYLLSGTIRRDGSSYFAPGHQWGTFPSATVGWRLSKETFLKNVSWLNDLKLRAGYGALGSLSGVQNQPSNAYTLYTQSPGNANYDINGLGGTGNAIGTYRSQLGNLTTTWETDKIKNIGLDATILNNKLDFSIEYFEKSITNLLFPDKDPSLALATVAVQNLPYVNGGNISNKGIELTANYHGNVGSDFKYDLGLNLSHYSNKVVSLNNGALYYAPNSAGSTRLQNFVRLTPGQPVGEFYGYKVIGLYKDAADIAASPTDVNAQPGFFKYQDTNHDGKITADDKTNIGNPNPKFTGGFTLNMSYKNFDFNAFLYGSFGGKVFNYIKYWTYFPQVFTGNVSADILGPKVWKPGADNTNATIPVLTRIANTDNTGDVNSWYVESGTYVRLKSLTIGYTFPKSAIKSIGVKKIRVYLLANNLFTITKYSGLDPELQASNLGDNTSFGIDFGNYPANQKIYNIGVNATF